MVLLFFGSTIFVVVLYRWVPVYATPLMFVRMGQQIWNGKTLRMQHHWVPLAEISPDLAIAVMTSEDQLFTEHSGFDWKSISAAVKEAEAGKRMRGASTISQQTAKNVFLCNGGGFVRKGLEAYFTVLIELVWGKERIMEVYLNSIEMGDGIYGAEAVAQQHFGISAARLTRNECALIAATLPNPLRFSSKEPSKYMLKRQWQIVRQMPAVRRLAAKNGWGQKEEKKKEKE